MKKSLFPALLYACLPLLIHGQNRIGTGPAKDLYLQYCATCHGQNMEGGQGSSLIDEVWNYGSSDAAMAKSILEGVPDLGMVPWKGVLTDQQVRSLVILIREQKLMAESAGFLEKTKPLGGVFSTRHHNFTMEKVADVDDILWSIAFLPDESILIAQRDGKLWRLLNGEKIGIEGIPQVWEVGQGGLMEVMPHPKYEENGWIYLSFSEHVGAKLDGKDAAMTAIVRGRIEGEKWVDEEEIFRVPQHLHTTKGGHFGSRFVFKDEYLFFSIGERQQQEMAQDLALPSGKIHRIYHDGRIPEGNPFFDHPGAFRTIWSYGNRNPQGLDLHPVTGDLWETEHGPRGGDELNIIRPGLNYGWPVITYGMNYDGTPITEKTHMEGMEQPAHYWQPSIAVCGIDFYEGDKFPKWKNNLLVSGMASEEIQRLVIRDGKVVDSETILKQQGRVRDVASGPDGYIYAAINTRSPNSGALYRLKPVPQPQWRSLFNGHDLDRWQVRSDSATVLVDDGHIVALPRGVWSNTFLATEESFGDFILELDLKIIGDLNAGILLRGVGETANENDGLKGHQIELDQSPHEFAVSISQAEGRQGWLYSLDGKEKAREAFQPSTWNRYRFEAIGEHLRVWINGVPTTNIIGGKTSKGVIGFQATLLPDQDGRGAAYIRNIQIISSEAGNHIRGIEIPAMKIKTKVSDQVRYKTIEEAIARNDLEDVVRHLEKNPQDIDKPGRGNMTPLHQAILRKRPEAAAILLEAGADPHVLTPGSQSSLHLAVERGLTKTAQKLLQKGVDASVRDSQGWTALHLAAARNRKQMVKMMLDQGVDPKFLSAAGGTPLHEAAVSGDGGMIRMLLDAGIDPKVVSQTGKTALDIAVDYQNTAARDILEGYN